MSLQNQQHLFSFFFLWTFGQLQIDYNINAYEQFARKTCSRKEEGKKIDSLNILIGAIQ